MHPTSRHVLTAAAALMISAACAKGGGDVSGTTRAVTVEVTPPSAEVAPGSPVSFAAAVTGSADTAVAWSVVEQGGGSVDSTGRYTAPAAPGTFHVRATSHADAQAFGEATVTVTVPPAAIAVALTPSPAATNSCRTITFTATVGGTTNQAVTWSVQEGAAGGTITGAGVYTAPGSAGTYHVVATSAADSSKTAVSTVTVTDRILSVAVSPSTAQLAPGATAQFTATVTTTCGSFASTATVTAPL